MERLTKLKKVNESFTVYRYDNGWMFEVTGRNKNDDWYTCKILCNTQEELVELIKEFNTMEVDR
jgi:hypothetical protein